MGGTMKLSEKVLLVFTLLLTIHLVSAQAEWVEAPVYRDGEWWRINHQVSRIGFDVSGTCTQGYAEYLVSIVDGKPKVFGVVSARETPIECPLISGLLFGAADLRFPMDVGSSWSDRR